LSTVGLREFRVDNLDYIHSLPTYNPTAILKRYGELCKDYAH